MWDKLGTPVTIGSNEPQKKPTPIKPSSMPTQATSGPSASLDKYNEQVPASDGLIFYRRLVDADNSCLFNAFSLALGSGVLEQDPQTLRKIVAEKILSCPSLFNETTLEKPPKDYAKWIQLPTSWGGAIELQILAEKFQIEICAIEIRTCMPYFFGSRHSGLRVFLIFDGIHYDYVAKGVFEEIDPKEDVALFSVEDEQALHNAICVANQLRKEKKFTDVNKFSLKCKVCLEGLIGEKEAVEHAKKTGHQSFEEYK